MGPEVCMAHQSSRSNRTIRIPEKEMIADGRRALHRVACGPRQEAGRSIISDPDGAPGVGYMQQNQGRRTRQQSVAVFSSQKNSEPLPLMPLKF